MHARRSTPNVIYPELRVPTVNVCERVARAVARRWLCETGAAQNGLLAGTAVLQEAEELAALAQAALQRVPVPQHLHRHHRHLARPEVEAAVEALDGREDLRIGQVRIAERRLLHAVRVQQPSTREPA